TAPATAMPSAIFAVFVTRAVEIADPRVAVPGQVRSCALGWRARASSQLRRAAAVGAIGVLLAQPRGRRHLQAVELDRLPAHLTDAVLAELDAQQRVVDLVQLPGEQRADGEGGVSEIAAKPDVFRGFLRIEQSLRLRFFRED